MKNVYQLLALFIVLVFLSSCSSPQDEAKKKLQSLGIEPTGKSLIIQSKEGNAENVSVLLTGGVPADSLGEKGYPALAWAAAKGHADVVKVLLAAGVDKERVDKDGDTALISAVKMGKIDAAVALVKAGMGLDEQDEDGETKLRYYTGFSNFKDLVKALAEGGADCNIADKNGRTAFTEAVDDGNTDFIALFAANGADVNALQFDAG